MRLCTFENAVGDLVRIEIDGLGALENPVVAEPALAEEGRTTTTCSCSRGRSRSSTTPRGRWTTWTRSDARRRR